MQTQKKDQLIIFGTGEHAKVCIDNIEDQGKYKIFGFRVFMFETEK